MTMDRRKWKATVAGLRVERTAMPPTTACTTTPTTMPTATTRRVRRWGRCVHTAYRASSASSPTTPVSDRLPNSMTLWKPCSWWGAGVKDPGTHSGHVGQPSPLPVSRTTPPVTTMATSPMRLARRSGRTRDGRTAWICTGSG